MVLDASYIADLKLAASNMKGAKRRSFQAKIAIKHCNGSARQAEQIFGWNRNAVQQGLHETRTGVVCVGGQKGRSGNKRWEQKYPEIAEAVWNIADASSQVDPSFQTAVLYTRLTAEEALKQLKALGFPDHLLPSRRSMSRILNRNNYRLKAVVKAKPQKKTPETDAIFANIKAHDKQSVGEDRIKRLSLDCKATVHIGEYSRGGKTRGDNRAADHDMGCTEKYVPFGILDMDTSQLKIFFGSSSKTSDFVADGLSHWVNNDISEEELSSVDQIQLRMDNGPESSGVRSQFLYRMVELADSIGKTIHLLYYPPYHSKYNRIERCWGILEKHWNGTKLIDASTMIRWARTMTWKGVSPIVSLCGKVYEKGVRLSKEAMKAVEARLERNPLLPKWDILIHPKKV